MKPVIKEVKGRRDLRRFVEYPNKLYKGNRYYVPQLVSADMDTLTPGKNHAFEYCRAKEWLALDGKGSIVGRIAMIINDRYNETYNVLQGRFGFIDFIEDEEVFDALIDTASAWAAEQGMNEIAGPLGFLEFDASGVCVLGYDEYPTAYGKYNFPYYETFFEKKGFTKMVDFVEYSIKVPDEVPEKYERVCELVKQRYHLHEADTSDKKQIMKYMSGVFDCMNEAYSRVHGYVQLSQGQKDDLARQFVPNVDPRFLSIILNEDDKVVGFGICMPSLSKAMQKARGHMFPFGWLHLLHALRHNDTLDMLLTGIREEYMDKGLPSIIISHYIRGIREMGIKYLETTRELETNSRIQNLGLKLEHRLHKRARVYSRPIESK